MITGAGIEGGAVYALSPLLRDAIAAAGPVTAHLDLRPDIAYPALARRTNTPRGSQSLSTFLRKAAGLAPVAIGLLREAAHHGAALGDLAGLIKAVPLRLEAPAPLARAISTAGGIALDEFDANFMLRRRPGCFVAGEMLDWEAPTGGYLLQACLSTGAAAGRGAAAWIRAASAVDG
jgi:predicted flavoprotein YhiN